MTGNRITGNWLTESRGRYSVAPPIAITRTALLGLRVNPRGRYLRACRFRLAGFGSPVSVGWLTGNREPGTEGELMVAAVVLIRAEREAIPSAAREVAEIAGVAEVYSVSGDWDLVAIVRVPEWEQIADVVAEKLAKVPRLERTYTLVAFRVYSRQDLDKAFDMFE